MTGEWFITEKKPSFSKFSQLTPDLTHDNQQSVAWLLLALPRHNSIVFGFSCCILTSYVSQIIENIFGLINGKHIILVIPTAPCIVSILQGAAQTVVTLVKMFLSR